MRKRRMGLYNLLYYSIILYTISTMTQDLVPFLPLNRIFYFGITVCVFAIMFVRVEKTPILYLSIIIFDMVLVHLAYNISGNILDYIYYITSLMWLLFISKEERRIKLLYEFKNHRTLNKIVIFFSVALITFALITKSGYQYAWGAAYFVGFSGLTHVAASSMCLVSSLMLLIYTERKYSWIVMAFLLIMCFGVFETGARTYIVPAVILVYLYISKCQGNKNLKFFIYAIGLVLVVVVLSKSNIVSKFNFTSNIDQYNKVDRLTQQTSGRATFWVIDLKGFLDSSFFAKVLGHGHGYTYYLNERFYHLRVWAHNDFIQVLVGGGLVTLYTYISALCKSISSVNLNHRFVDRFLLIMYCLFPAFFNGFYNYSHYFLSFIIICLLYNNFVDNRIARNNE